MNSPRASRWVATALLVSAGIGGIELLLSSKLFEGVRHMEGLEPVVAGAGAVTIAVAVGTVVAERERTQRGERLSPLPLLGLVAALSLTFFLAAGFVLESFRLSTFPLIAYGVLAASLSAVLLLGSRLRPDRAPAVSPSLPPRLRGALVGASLMLGLYLVGQGLLWDSSVTGPDMEFPSPAGFLYGCVAVMLAFTTLLLRKGPLLPRDRVLLIVAAPAVATAILLRPVTVGLPLWTLAGIVVSLSVVAALALLAVVAGSGLGLPWNPFSRDPRHRHARHIAWLAIGSLALVALVSADIFFVGAHSDRGYDGDPWFVSWYHRDENVTMAAFSVRLAPGERLHFQSPLPVDFRTGEGELPSPGGLDLYVVGPGQAAHVPRGELPPLILHHQPIQGRSLDLTFRMPAQPPPVPDTEGCKWHEWCGRMYSVQCEHDRPWKELYCRHPVDIVLVIATDPSVYAAKGPCTNCRDFEVDTTIPGPVIRTVDGAIIDARPWFAGAQGMALVFLVALSVMGPRNPSAPVPQDPATAPLARRLEATLLVLGIAALLAIHAWAGDVASKALTLQDDAPQPGWVGGLTLLAWVPALFLGQAWAWQYGEARRLQGKPPLLGWREQGPTHVRAAPEATLAVLLRASGWVLVATLLVDWTLVLNPATPPIPASLGAAVVLLAVLCALAGWLLAQARRVALGQGAPGLLAPAVLSGVAVLAGVPVLGPGRVDVALAHIVPIAVLGATALFQRRVPRGAPPVASRRRPRLDDPRIPAAIGMVAGVISLAHFPNVLPPWHDPVAALWAFPGPAILLGVGAFLMFGPPLAGGERAAARALALVLAALFAYATLGALPYEPWPAVLLARPLLLVSALWLAIVLGPPENAVPPGQPERQAS